MKLTPGLFVIFFLCSVAAVAQKNNLKAAKVTAADFNLPVSAIIDSSTSAVIISDVGVTDFVGNKSGWFSYVFKRRTRIKILNKKAFGLASVKIRLYVNERGRRRLVM